MRALAWLFASLLIAAIGCGDGVGRPIESRASVVAEAASGSGGAASGAGGTTGAAGATAGTPGATNGFGGLPSTLSGSGGAAGRRVDFEPPWEGDPGGRGGPDWDEPGEMRPVPEGPFCELAADWDASAEAAEWELFQVLSFARQQGFACDGGEEMVAPRLDLHMSPELRCAARLHSRDMSEGPFCDHVNLEGDGPEDRIRATGYMFRVAGESITCDLQMTGFQPSEVLTRLIAAGGGDCKNLLDGRFDAVGIGRFGDLWTLDFAGP